MKRIVAVSVCVSACIPGLFPGGAAAADLIEV